MIVANTSLNNKFWKLKMKFSKQKCHKWRITYIYSSTDILKQSQLLADFLVLGNILLVMN